MELGTANCICNLVATQGDGTPFSPDSFQEEDVVELCVGLGQAHPEGVLWLSDTKMVLMFQSGSEMMAVIHFLLWPWFGMINPLSSVSTHLQVHR